MGVRKFFYLFFHFVLPRLFLTLIFNKVTIIMVIIKIIIIILEGN